MLINKITILKTPFTKDYTDVLDVFDYKNKTEQEITDLIKTKLLTYDKIVFTDGLQNKAVNVSDFSCVVTLRTDNTQSEIIDYNYMIINENNFYFIDSIKQENSLSYITYTFTLTKDIWNTYYPKLVKSGANLDQKIIKKHQKRRELNSVTVNHDFILDTSPKKINTYYEFHSDNKNNILWARIILKKPTANVRYRLAGATDINGHGFDMTQQGYALANPEYNAANLPYSDGPEVYFPVAICFSPGEPFNLKFSGIYVRQPSRENTPDNEIFYDVGSFQNYYSTVLASNEFIESIELTFLAPFSIKTYYGGYNYVLLEENNAAVSGIQYEDSNGLHTLLTQCFVDVPNAPTGIVFDNSYGSDFSAPKYSGNSGDIIADDEIYNKSIALKTFPYKNCGFLVGESYRIFSKVYFGYRDEDKFILSVDRCADGIALSVELLNNRKYYAMKKYDKEFESHKSIIPISQDQKGAYLIANGNSIIEEKRAAKERLYADVISNAGSAGIAAIGGAATGNLLLAGGAAISATAGLIKAGSSYEHTLRGIDAKIADLGNLPSRTRVSGNGAFNSCFISGRILFFREHIVNDINSRFVAKDEYLYGTNICKFDNVFANTREQYDFVCAENAAFNCSSINKKALAILSAIVIKGVRKWHSDNETMNSELNPYVKNDDWEV